VIIVTPETFEECVRALFAHTFLAVDTETTGLFPYKKDRLFSIQFSTSSEDYYFNFIEYSPEQKAPVLSYDLIPKLQPLFTRTTLFLQNAKFDMAFLRKEGINFNEAQIHDTEVVGRLLRNDHLKYSLDAQCERELGERKDDSVMEWLKKNKKYSIVEIPGKDTPYKAYHFDEVPFELITRYGCKDTRLTFHLAQKQLQQLDLVPDLSKVVEMESKLIHVCAEIERVGIGLDRDYCQQAADYESKRAEIAEEEFEKITGQDLTDSGKFLGPIFEALGFKPEFTETGEFEVAEGFLSSVTHPLAEIVLRYRDARKRANNYFKGYLHFVDRHGNVHADMRQAGTRTGRFSYRDPNLQNISGDTEEVEFPIRRAFVPRPGFFFLSLDYKQMEFCMLLDESGQQDLIQQLKSGHDAHDATAKLTGLSRKQAKTLNFGLLYGMGVAKLGAAIGVSREEAAKFKRQYFAALPMVEHFILQCSGAVRQRISRDPGNGWIKTWFGRRGYFDDEKWSYKAANFRIQGGCADVVKIAMCNLHDLLKDKKSRMVLQVHDELLFEVAFDEQDIIGEIIKTMESAYPARSLPMSVSVGYSLKSFYDIVEEDPRGKVVGQEGGEHIQGADLSKP